MSDKPFEVLEPDSIAPWWTVTGVAPEGQPSHYDIEDTLKASGEFNNITFDSEAGQFFAYAFGPKPANRLVDLLNERYGKELA